MKSYKTVYIAGEQKRTHRYKMEQHLGRKLLTSELIHHKDGDKNNNDVDNLEIVSRGNHMKMHNVGIGTRFKTKLTRSIIQLIQQLYSIDWAPQWKLAEMFNVAQSTVSRIVNEK